MPVGEVDLTDDAEEMDLAVETQVVFLNGPVTEVASAARRPLRT